MTGPARGVQRYWARQRDLIWSLPAAVVAREDDAIHDLRAAGRRLRSTLRVFRPLLRRNHCTHLVEELGWYNGILGAARDAEVIAEQLAGLEGHDEFDRRRETLALLAEQMLVSRRTGLLLDDLDHFIRSPWRGGEGPDRDQMIARLDWTERRVAAAWRTVRSDPEDLPGSEHRLRRRAKTARYTLEALSEGVEGASERAGRYADLASRLGVMQDAVVLARALPQDSSQAAHEILTERRARAAEARDTLAEAVSAALPHSHR
jgi:CHAD domain-containing protein